MIGLRARRELRLGCAIVVNFLTLLFISFPFDPAQAQTPFANPNQWAAEMRSKASLILEPTRESAKTQDGLELAFKHFPRPGAQPVLLIHGLAQNDRCWDSTLRQYSFARFLHAQGFDVWLGNLRGAGTPGFRSQTPDGPHHWTIDDYAIYDLPALVDTVRAKTGQAPFVIGHSLAAWAIEGYLAGITYDRTDDGARRVIPHPQAGLDRQHSLRGVATIAGVYNMRWEHSIAQATTDPIRNALDYYHSDYELELLAKIKPLFRIIPSLWALPLNWVNTAINLPLGQIPWIGSRLTELYLGLQMELIQTPILNLFYFSPEVDPELVRLHAKDGLEDLGPHVIEQLANAIKDQKILSYYHLQPTEETYDYNQIQKHIDLPMLFVGGGRDRLASALEVYEDGYLKTNARDKQYIYADTFGHMDILSGIHAPQEVMMPVAEWLKK
ncbi:alpha/beta fold hydrolase [Bdellovibrionota bacterium FG-1]